MTVKVTQEQLEAIEIGAESLKMRNMKVASIIWGWLDNLWKDSPLHEAAEFDVSSEGPSTLGHALMSLGSRIATLELALEQQIKFNAILLEEKK